MVKNLITVHLTSEITTLDAVPVAALTYSLPKHTSALVAIKAVGVDDKGNTLVFESRCAIKKAQHNCEIVGLPAVIYDTADGDLLNAQVMPNADGAMFNVYVAGLTETHVQWAISIEISYLSHEVKNE